MSLPVSSQVDLYNLFITILQDEAPDLTDTLSGSTIDILAGVFSIAGTELTRLIQNQFNKTFISLANGPAVTGSADDLQTLAVDHFGSAFARPQASAAVDTATFTRANNAAGAITILAGTIIATPVDASGNSQTYTTNSTVVLTQTGAGTDTSVSVGITAVIPGSAGNATAGTITVIQSSLLDPTIDVTNAGNATGEDAQDDATYRQTIYNLIEGLRGATLSAIQATALTVPGVVVASATQIELPVIQYNTGTGAIQGGATYFQIPYVTLYVADNTGTASPSLIAEIVAAIASVTAYGIYINVASATPVTINWSGSVVLNPAGPNYATFVSNPAAIVQSMYSYIQTLTAGTSFIRATANAAMLAIWGPSGTNDITAFTTSLPAGDVSLTTSQKTIPGAVKLV